MSTDLEVRPSAEVFAQGRIRFTETGAEIPEDVTYEEWEPAFDELLRVDKATRWNIGDMLLFKGGRYGEMYAAALTETGLSYESLKKAKSISGRFEMGRRRPNLTWSHHQELAKLPAAEQDEWLDKAEAKRLTRAELRELLRAEGKREEARGKEKPKPLGLASQRNRQLAERAKERLGTVIAGLDGYREGLEDFDVRRALALTDDEEKKEWVRILASSEKALSELRTRINNGG